LFFGFRQAIVDSALFSVAEKRRLSEGEHDEFFAGKSTDVVVQTQHLRAGHVQDHRFQDGPGRFNQLSPDLFEQVSPLVGGKRLDKLLLGGGQDALKSDNEEVADEVSVNILRSTAHVLLLEAAHARADSCLDLALGFHCARNSETDAKICSTFPKSPGLTK
jgi:hypothetical protein